MTTAQRELKRLRRIQALGLAPLAASELTAEARALEESSFFAQNTRSEVRLWDVIDARWTQPVEAGMARQLYTRMVAYKCSACPTAALFKEEIPAHVRQVRERALQHGSARVGSKEVGNITMPICTGCGVSFQRGASYAERHIKEALAAPQLHQGAHQVVVLRYRLEPPAFVPREGLPPQVPGMGPVASQEERRRPRRRRHRRGRGSRTP